MGTLIGGGGHATDIAATFTTYWVRVTHHKDYELTRHPEPIIIGINDPLSRAQIAEDLDCHDIAWVHPQAWVGPGCDIGHGTHVNYGVSMTRTKIGVHCTIAPGVTICGDVTIGDRVFIGAGAVIRNMVSIGDEAFIRMGSVVTRDVKPGERY